MNRPKLHEKASPRVVHSRTMALERGVAWTLTHSDGPELLMTLIASHCRTDDVFWLRDAFERLAEMHAVDVHPTDELTRH